jgi:chaperonin GroEL
MMHAKPKDASKIVLTKYDDLESKVLSAALRTAEIVGATLGPGGCPVLIERQETTMPAMVTKDGVTVARSLAYKDPAEHEVMQAMRDAAVRTVTEAGDGTTTSLVLAEAILRRTRGFCEENPKISPQRVVQRLRNAMQEIIEPAIARAVRKADMADPEGQRLLRAVAKVSANGDEALADAVIKCFDLVGDDGNVTIQEQTGPVSKYEVERLEGYPLNTGYEESCTRFFPMFINDQHQQRVYLERPVFVLYHGAITEIQTLVMLMTRIGKAWQDEAFNHNVVVCATGFSESVVGELGFNFRDGQTLNVYPMVVPKSALHNSQLHILQDLAALTRGEVFDPISKPLDSAKLEQLGGGVQYFEASRYRTNIVGYDAGPEIENRVQELHAQTEGASILERSIIEERIGKLTGGIAKLLVLGSSNGELRERRDRAEDAVMAVRGALRHGCVPGGGWMLARCDADCQAADDADRTLSRVLAPALREVVRRLYRNAGMIEAEAISTYNQLIDHAMDGEPQAYDLLADRWVDCFEAGLLDSTPAVREAIRNAISIAGLLGTLGGIVVFQRDREVDVNEARDAQEFYRTIGVNEADERI